MVVTKEFLEKEILRTFSNAYLGTGKTLRECVALDEGLDPEHPDLAFIPDYDRWQDIPDKMIEFVATHGVLVFCDTPGVKFYLPAAMLYVLQRYDGDYKSNAFHVACRIQALDGDTGLNEEQSGIFAQYKSYIADEYPELFSNDA